MSPTRRAFLRTGALAAISAGFALSSARAVFGQDPKQSTSLDFEIPYQAKLDPVFNYTKATFDPFVGGIFIGRGVGGARVNLTLVAVRDLNPAPASPRTSATSARQLKRQEMVRVPPTPKSRPTDSFKLLFRASAPLSELSTIHPLEHAALGKFSLFMVHSEEADGQHFYEAVITRAIQ